MKKIWLLFLFVICTTFSLEIYACSTKSFSEFASKKEQIQASKNIVLAKAIKQELKNNHIHTTFSIIEALKGNADKTLELSFDAFSTPNEHNFDSDFKLHLDGRFWSNLNARTAVSSNCNYFTNFRIGNNYLLFIDKPYQANSFELIKSEDDYWYRLVKQIIANPDSTLMVTPLAFLKGQWSVYTARCPDKTMTGKQRMHKLEAQLVGTNPYIKQVPSYVDISPSECRKTGAKYLAIQYSADSRPFAFKISNGEVDLSGLTLDGLTLSNKGRINLEDLQ
jgi:hypothetical protein